MRGFLLVLSAIALSGCSSNGARIDANARGASLVRYESAALGFRTLIYMKAPLDRSEPLYIFLEGDGAPWRGGVIPNDDPTTRDPVALELLKRTARGGAYLTRPCYHRMPGPRCTPDRWTGARYSEEVIAVMAEAVHEAMRLAEASRATLVGYSGGGVLAVLLAERVNKIDAVVTLGANLDIDAWTRRHGYLRLEGSLNPAHSEREHVWREVHLQGARDANVPPDTTDAYFARYPNAERRVIEDFDHVCCWVDAWPGILEREE
jgi:pimeloyl-ACP methyl ester carboxylesterase